MAVSCQASGPANGNYSVTCQATLNLSDGTSYSSDTASDTFLVSQMTVNVAGDPYVIIPEDGTPDSDTESAFTAPVSGGSTPYDYNWSTSGNIAMIVPALAGSTASASQSIQVDGTGPAGSGTVTCEVLSSGGEPSQSGTTQAQVLPEFVLTQLDSPYAGSIFATGAPAQNCGPSEVPETSVVPGGATVGVGGPIPPLDDPDDATEAADMLGLNFNYGQTPVNCPCVADCPVGSEVVGQGFTQYTFVLAVGFHNTPTQIEPYQQSYLTDPKPAYRAIVQAGPPCP
jgi:hypothetical protein